MPYADAMRGNRRRAVSFSKCSSFANLFGDFCFSGLLSFRKHCSKAGVAGCNPYATQFLAMAFIRACRSASCFAASSTRNWVSARWLSAGVLHPINPDEPPNTSQTRHFKNPLRTALAATCAVAGPETASLHALSLTKADFIAFPAQFWRQAFEITPSSRYFDPKLSRLLKPATASSMLLPLPGLANPPVIPADPQE